MGAWVSISSDESFVQVNLSISINVVHTGLQCRQWHHGHGESWPISTPHCRTVYNPCSLSGRISFPIWTHGSAAKGRRKTDFRFHQNSGPVLFVSFYERRLFLYLKGIAASVPSLCAWKTCESPFELVVLSKRLRRVCVPRLYCDFMSVRGTPLLHNKSLLQRHTKIWFLLLPWPNWILFVRETRKQRLLVHSSQAKKRNFPLSVTFLLECVCVHHEFHPTRGVIFSIFERIHERRLSDITMSKRRLYQRENAHCPKIHFLCHVLRVHVSGLWSHQNHGQNTSSPVVWINSYSSGFCNAAIWWTRTKTILTTTAASLHRLYFAKEPEGWADLRLSHYSQSYRRK